jgi:uncharacterized LabA/DUF88 family protein
VPVTTTSRIAVLIDADNTSASHAGALLQELARYGVPTVKRAYGDWTTQQLVRWKEQLHRHAIQPIQQFAYTTGKNSTDSALIIDAMDLLYSGTLDAFAIVSSDSDFTRLATRLRESGKTVYGIGRRRTPASLVAAVDRFIFLEVLGDTEAAEPADAADSADTAGASATGTAATAAAESPEDAVPLPDLRKMLTAAVNSTSQDDGWSTLSQIGSHLGRSNPSFDSRNHGFPKLVDLVRSQDYLDVEQVGQGVRVRLRSARPARKSPVKKQAAQKQPAQKKAGTKAKSG